MDQRVFVDKEKHNVFQCHRYCKYLNDNENSWFLNWRDVNKLITSETLDSKTRTTTWWRFCLEKDFAYSQELKNLGKLHCSLSFHQKP